MIANLAVFYKGSVSIYELKQKPVPELFRLQSYAERILREAKQEAQ